MKMKDKIIEEIDNRIAKHRVVLNTSKPLGITYEAGLWAIIAELEDLKITINQIRQSGLLL